MNVDTKSVTEWPITPKKQESLANAKLTARHQGVYEGRSEEIYDTST